MRLSDYQWSGNPRGMHNIAAFTPIVRERYPALQLGWYKFVTGGEEFAPDCEWLLANNITPVIRIYRAAPGADPMSQDMRNQFAVYARSGVKWFEFFNEPNFKDPEWPPDTPVWVDHRNVDEVIRPLCESWMEFAEYIISLGGYPGFFSLGETSGENGAIQWLDALLGYLRDHYNARFNAVVRSGLWYASHPYVLNHFYQETPGQPARPRPPEQYNALEGGWRFEYPYDPYTQSFDPGRTVFGNTPATPYGDPNGLIAMGTAFNQRIAEWFSYGPLPVFGTEGGIYPLPTSSPQQPDPRFPPYDRTAHAEATVAMFNWLATQAPDWAFGVALWKEDEYYFNQLPAIPRMEQVEQLLKGGAQRIPNLIGVGPGPIQGQPTFHLVVLAPGLDPNWFYETARSYWNTFRPVVTTTWDMIRHVPYDRSLAATVIAPPDVAEAMRQVIQQQYPNVLFDLIEVTGDFSGLREVLNQRVYSNRRFG